MRNLVIIAMLLVSGVVLSQQRSISYSFYSRDGIVEKAEITKDRPGDLVRTDEVLTFENDVPKLTEAQILALKNDGRIEYSRKKVKGFYKNVVLYYVPCIEVDSCFLDENHILYKGYVLRLQEQEVAWWFLFAILGVVSMIFFQKFNNAFAFAFAGAFAFAFAVAVAVAFAFAFAFAGAFAGAVAFAVAFADNKGIKNIFAYIYYVLMILASVLAYFQI